jgi:hypothetical protein
VQDSDWEKRLDSIPNNDTQPPNHPRSSIGRVMAFGYISSRGDARFDQTLEQLSTTLISNLLDWRETSSNPNAPLVFIGTGLSCLIIQEAIRLTGESEEKQSEWSSLLNMTAGISFLNAPASAPVQKKEPKEEPRKDGTKAEEPKKEPGVPRAVFPPVSPLLSASR